MSYALEYKKKQNEHFIHVEKKNNMMSVHLMSCLEDWFCVLLLEQR